MSTALKTTPSTTRMAVTAFLVSALSACAGGGTGNPNAVTTTPNGVTLPLVSTLVSSVPAASYAPASEALAAFNLVNAERAHCGFGLLAQNTQLDRAAAAHTRYELLNAIYVTHDELPTNPGFSGVDPGARAKTQGYSGAGAVGEVAAATSAMPGVNPGEQAIRLWLSAPYHQAGLLASYRDVGISILADSSIIRRAIINLGIATNTMPQLPSSTEVSTYPCAGSTGVNRLLRGETPNPVPGRDLSINPIGTPVLVQVRSGHTLTVTSASMIGVSNGQVIALRPAIGSANDPNGVKGVSPYFAGNTAYVAPDSALEPNAQYQMQVNGTNNGVPFGRTFTFTTGAE